MKKVKEATTKQDKPRAGTDPALNTFLIWNTTIIFSNAGITGQITFNL